MSNPRRLQEQQLAIILFYSQLSMTPVEFYGKWGVTYEQMAVICSRSDSTVRRWFKRGQKHQFPQATDLRHLAVMNFLLEHFEPVSTLIEKD